jgi:phosphoglucomutase/phosphomannomutase
MSFNPAQLVGEARRGVKSLDLPGEIKASAIVHLEDWLATDKFAGLVPRSDYTQILRWMVESESFDLLVDSFYQVIPFGTGGRRGPVGVGPNRINPYTIGSSVQGHVEYLRMRFPDTARLKVVVAYDVRKFHNLRETYPRTSENPLLGLTSRDLAGIAASVYAAAGVEVYTLPENSTDFISTPELSFLIRRISAHGGVNVSASHNHPDDNGSKFYNSEGGQEIPPDDEELAAIVDRVKEIRVDTDGVTGRSEFVREVPEDARQAFIDMNLGLRLRQAPGRGKLVFTGLHGTGTRTVGRCLEAMGFAKGRQLFYVDEQCEIRSDFRNVTFRSPNPEVPESLELGVRRAEEVNADLVLATDPDADRLGGASRDGDRYRFVSGNEFASIMTRYRLDSLEAAGELPARPLGIKTVVTTDLVRKLVESRDGVVVGDLLVGFKYIAAVLASLERSGQFRGLASSVDDFVIAAEESHGFMLTPAVRDKDAAGAAVVLAELTSELAARGETVYDYLIDTYKRYGYHANTVRSTVMQGAAGSAKIRKIQQELRSAPPPSIGGREVLEVNDYWDESKYGPFLSETDRSSRNLVSFSVEGGIKATIRPSGTEPKNKLYLELAAAPLGPEATRSEFEEHRQQVDREVKDFSNSFLAEMLSLIGVTLPEYAFDISDLVALQHKVDFCDRFLPEFERRAEEVLAKRIDEASASAWVDETLRPYGPDARVLVNRAFDAYSSTVPQSDRLQVQRRIIRG